MHGRAQDLFLRLTLESLGMRSRLFWVTNMVESEHGAAFGLSENSGVFWKIKPTQKIAESDDRETNYLDPA